MQRKDYFLEEIQKMSRLLSEICGSFLKRGISEDAMTLIKTTEENLKTRVGIDIRAWAVGSTEQVRKELEAESYSSKNIEYIATYVLERTHMVQEETRKEQFLKLALLLCDIADEKADTYSIERGVLKMTIKSQLDNNHV